MEPRLQPGLSLLWGDLTPGPYAVGYRDGRWYPAQAEGDRVHFRDYIPMLDEWDRHLHHLRFTDAEIVELFDTLMYARHAAPPAEGEFPTVVLASPSVPDHAVLAEYIASHGYVVTVGMGGRRVDENVSTVSFVRRPSRAARAARRILSSLP